MKTPKNSSPKFRLLFVLENYYPNIGGVEKLFKTLAETLAAAGHSVTIVTTRLSNADPSHEILAGVRIHRYRFSNRYLFTFLALFPVLRHARNCDLVHTTSYNAALPAYIGAKLAGKKAVVTFHEVWGDLWFRLPFMGGLAKRLHYGFEQVLLRLRFDGFIGVSRSTSANLVAGGVLPQLVHTILNGIDYQEFSQEKSFGAGKNFENFFSLSPLPFTYTYFGRLGISKGLDVLLDAAKTFSKEHPESRLKLIIPTTPEGFFRKIISEIERLGLKNHVRLLHHLSFEELKRELLASHCVVIPSLSEGFCFAAVEAIALGVPVISSDRAALKEVVSGRFIKMKNVSADALTDALRRALAGDWEESPLRKFELKDTVEAYLNLYEKLLTKSDEP